MRFPSVELALQQSRASFRRFPLAILSGLLATVVVLRMIEGPTEDWQPRMVATLVVGLALFTASATTAERFGVSGLRRWLTDLGIALSLSLLYLTSHGWTERHAFLRFAQLLVTAHLVVAVAPYLGGGGLRGFWQYNRFLFLRFLVATLHAGVLWVGLAVALAAIDKLFGVNIRSETYAQLWAVMAFSFHPWFFLGGVPQDYAELDRLEEYPGGLKVFTQYVLIPLVVIYLAILTTYLGKVLLTRTWPSGWIGYLVSSVSATGVLALLLVHPIREREDSRWVRAYGRWWFVALLPSLVMLLLAVAQRIGQYGITEPRYFLLVLTLWLLGLALYYSRKGSENIKLIPVTLALVAALSAFGPWGADAVSRRSQTMRFSRILAANGMGGAGEIVPAREPVAPADRRELSAILRYLETSHGEAAVARVIGVPVDSVLVWKAATASGTDSPVAAGAMRRIGLRYASRAEGMREANYFWANLPTPVSYEITGFDHARGMAYPGMGWIGGASDSLELVKGAAAATVLVKHNGDSLFTLDLGAAIADVLPADSLLEGSGRRLAAPIRVEGEGGGYRLRLLLDQIAGRIVAGRLELQSANAFVLAGGSRLRAPAPATPEGIR